MEKISYRVLHDCRVINAVLRCAMKANNVPKGILLYANPHYQYIEIARMEDDAPFINYDWMLFRNIEYKGKIYESKFISGCFNPYVVEVIKE